MRLPKQLWYVGLHESPRGKVRRTKKAGGVMSTESGALARAAELQRAGVSCTVYVTACDWEAFKDYPQHIPGQQELF